MEALRDSDLVFGLWSLVFGLWSLVFGLWSLVFGLDLRGAMTMPLRMLKKTQKLQPHCCICPTLKTKSATLQRSKTKDHKAKNLRHLKSHIRVSMIETHANQSSCCRWRQA